MTSNLAVPVFSWKNFFITLAYLSLAAILVSIGIALASGLPPIVIAGAAIASIVIILALIVVRFIDLLSLLQIPLLFLVCIVSGIMLSQFASDFQHIILATALLSVNFILLTICATWVSLELQRFNLLLAVLAICFSFIGGILIFVQGSAAIQLIWLLAAIICFDLLLYILMKQIYEATDTPEQTAFAGVVLLHIALLMNFLWMVQNLLL